MAMLHARAFPDDVAGLVLVDPMNPGFVAATGDFVYSTVPQIREPANDGERATARLVRTFPGLLREIESTGHEPRGPMVVVTAGEPWWGREDVVRAWRASHEAIAAAPGRRLLVAEGSNHDVPEKRPEAIREAVLWVLDRVGRD
jgi:pimeloyl-ACP methyl ester carboxylesterase